MSGTQEQILDAGRDLIMSRGYNGFSYADVAESVGIRKASIHHYFPAKSDLARAVIEVSRAGLHEQSKALEKANLDPVVELGLYTGHWERCIHDGSATFCIAAMLATELPTLPADLARDVKAHFDEVTHWLERVIARGAADGTFKLSASPKVEADAFLAMVYGAMILARVRGKSASFVAIVEASLAKIVTRKSARGARPTE